MAQTPEIAEVTRTYGGQEGRRVKANTRFAVGTPVGGLALITPARYRQLEAAGLARPWLSAATPQPSSTPVYAKPEQAVKQPIKTASRSVNKAKARNAKNPEAPREPSPLENPASGRTGASESSSSSAADQASKKATMGLRGTRRSQRSPSTTPTASPPGPQGSTPATGNGGGSTKARQGSKA